MFTVGAKRRVLVALVEVGGSGLQFSTGGALQLDPVNLVERVVRKALHVEAVEDHARLGRGVGDVTVSIRTPWRVLRTGASCGTARCA